MLIHVHVTTLLILSACIPHILYTYADLSACGWIRLILAGPHRMCDHNNGQGRVFRRLRAVLQSQALPYTVRGMRVCIYIYAYSTEYTVCCIV